MHGPAQGVISFSTDDSGNCDVSPAALSPRGCGVGGGDDEEDHQEQGRAPGVETHGVDYHCLITEQELSRIGLMLPSTRPLKVTVVTTPTNFQTVKRKIEKYFSQL